MRRLLLLFVVLIARFAAAQAYQIENYDVQMRLDTGGNLAIRERIAVRFNESRRGIFRNIPRRYDTGRGAIRGVDITNVKATDEAGNPVTTKVTFSGDNVNIRLGDAAVFLPPGTRKTYQIEYTAFGMLNWFAMDEWEPTVELYWNVIGDGWDTEIGPVSFYIEFPHPASDGLVRARLFAGPYGSQEFVEVSSKTKTEAGSNGRTLSLQGNKLSGRYSLGVRPGEAVTLVLALPAKTIPQPTFLQAAWRFIRFNPIVLMPLIAILVMFTLWMFYGNDPRPGPMVVQFEPPETLSAASAGALLDESIDRRDIAAAFIQLATKGFLKFRIEEKQGWFGSEKTFISLTGKQGGGEDLGSFEAALLAALRAIPGEGEISELDLKTHIGPKIGSLESHIYEDMVRKGYYRSNPEGVRNGLLVLGILTAVGGCIVPAMLTKGSSPPWVAMLSFIVTGIVIMIFARIMPRRTHAGVQAWNRVRGFEEFIRRAQSDELDWLSKKLPDQALFEEYLPYAVAFGLTAEWTNAFRSIELHNPDWYVGRPYGMFYPNVFVSDLTRSVESVSAAAMTPPRSSGGSGGHSGFGGGGFSGGGFGGGGGGSW